MAISVLCECADVECIETFDVTVVEYEGIRTLADRFLVLPGHVFPEVEDVVQESDVFAVVAKVEAGADVAATLHPRTAKPLSSP